MWIETTQLFLDSVPFTVGYVAQNLQALNLSAGEKSVHNKL